MSTLITPLVWKDYDQSIGFATRVLTPSEITLYTIYGKGGQEHPSRLYDHQSNRLGTYDSPEAAKQAAQDHWDAKIHAAVPRLKELEDNIRTLQTAYEDAREKAVTRHRENHGLTTHLERARAETEHMSALLRTCYLYVVDLITFGTERPTRLTPDQQKQLGRDLAEHWLKTRP